MKNTARNLEMKKFTVIAYVVPSGEHHVEIVNAADATTAAVGIRDRLELRQSEFEIVGVITGGANFELVDQMKLALASISAESP